MRGRRLPQFALDIGFVNPQAAAHLEATNKEQTGAAKEYTESKRDKDDIQPLVWETTGGIAPEAADTLRSMN